MTGVDVFERHARRYDEWFERHDAAFRSELRAVRALLPEGGKGVEIGVGTGRFAGPLGVGWGIDPSGEMLVRARRRGIRVVRGVAEALPFPGEAFDVALMVTTVCFLDDEGAAIAEMRRVLVPGGRAVVGFVDGHSRLGRLYEERRESDVFYRGARFVAPEEVGAWLRRAGFRELGFVQTLRGNPETMSEPEPVTGGHGEGGFVVVRAIRS